MSGKFMKIRKIIIPTLTLIMIASQLCVCSCSRQDETLDMINRGEQIEIEVAVPDFEEQGTESKITWVELAKNTEDESFRKAFEIILGITNENNIKNGIAYIDLDGKIEQNNTLYNAFMNKAFVDNYWNNEETQQAVAIAVGEHYADIETDSNSARYAALYLYWNLLPDYEPNYANMGASLTRAEAMTMLMRATTPVTEDGKPASDAEFEALVGESDYAGYASYLNSKAYINTSDKSLNSQTFNGTMTRGEFIYLLINSTFGADAINNVEVSSTKLNDCKDGASGIEAQKFGNGDYSTSYKLVYALQNPDEGAPTPIYKAIVKAKQFNIISAETAWDEALTREDAAELFVETMLAYNNVNGYKQESTAGVADENKVKLEAEAKEVYNTIKDTVDIGEREFISSYVDLITNQGLTKEEAIEKLKTYYGKETEQPTTEAPTEKPVEKPTEKPTTGKTEKPTLSLEEAGKLTPSGSYTEIRFKLGPDWGDLLKDEWGIRRTYENGAIRDFILLEGEEIQLDEPITYIDYDHSAGPMEQSTSNKKPSQETQDSKPEYTGEFPPRSNYSTDAEWDAAVEAIISQNGGKYSYQQFASEADAKLFASLSKGEFTGDTEFINMTTEEWLKWCEENGFTVN